VQLPCATLHPCVVEDRERGIEALACARKEHLNALDSAIACRESGFAEASFHGCPQLVLAAAGRVGWGLHLQPHAWCDLRKK
jgi:hypothetical protein